MPAQMVTMQIREKEITLIKEYLTKKILPYLVVLFGSVVKERLRQDSDIDIAFLSDCTYSSYELFIISQELASLLGRDVDLIDLGKASTVFQMQIVNMGKTIYCSNENKRMLFELTTLKKYIKLNEERKYLLEKIKKRGTVYAS